MLFLRRAATATLFLYGLAPSVYASVVAKRATCTPASAGNSGVDDVPAIEAAFKSCGNGGIIVIPAGKTYAIRSTVDFTGCVNCEFQVEGTLKMSEDLNFWNGQRATFLISGITGLKMTSVTGGGLIDGNGVPYWIKFAADSSYARPTLVYITGSKSVTITNLRFKNPANVFHSVTGGSTNIVYSNLRLDATATDTATPKNTDGFDIGSSTYVTVRDTTIKNQDDCVVLKPGSNYAYATNITCSGSHGLSVGSLGKGQGSQDTVTNGWFGPATMIDSAKAVGIKLYEGGSTHGVATVRNVTWSDIKVQNCDYAAQIQSCYGAADTSNCIASTHSITGVKFINFSGTTSSKYNPTVANLNCPKSGTCDLTMTNFNVNAYSGTRKILCSNVDSALGVTCNGAASG